MWHIKNLPTADSPVREVTKTPVTPRKEFRAPATQMGEPVHTATDSWVRHRSKLHGRVAKRKKLLLNLS